MKSSKLLVTLALMMSKVPRVLGMSCSFQGINIPCNNLSNLGWGVIAGSGAIILFIIIFWGVMFIDLIKRTMGRKGLWIIFLLIGGLPGALIYYFAVKRKARRKSKESIYGGVTTSALRTPKATGEIPAAKPLQNSPESGTSQTIQEKPNLQKIKEQLTNYRNAALARGYTKEQIRRTFLEKGYPQYIINEVLGNA